MRQVKSGDTIKVHYHGKLTDGTTFDSSAGREPLEFEVGAGMMIPGSTVVYWEWKLVKRKTINIPCCRSLRRCAGRSFMEFPVDRFPPDMKAEVGMALNMSNGQDNSSRWYRRSKRRSGYT